jgi:hypothetical protein
VTAGTVDTGSIEQIETSGLVSGTANEITDLDALQSTAAGGSITIANGISTFLTNAGSTGTWNGLLCTGNGGNIPTVADNCVNNNDPLQLIFTKGHIRFFAEVQPTVTNCGTGAALDGNSSNSQGLITEGSGATGCTITWATFDPWLSTVTPHCDLSSPNASSLISYTPTTATLTLVNLASQTTAAPKFKWSCFQ